MKEPTEREKPIVASLGEAPPENPELERQAKLVERAVYGKPLVIHHEPSIGTEDTPARTDELYQFHVGGYPKQGDDEPIDTIGPPHLPRVIRREPAVENLSDREGGAEEPDPYGNML